MIRNLLVALLSCFVIGKASAQITLGTNDFSHANDTFRVSNSTPFPGMDLNGGANYTWDYSQLVSLSQTIDTFLSISSLPTTLAGYFGFIRPCNQATYSATSYLALLGIPVSGTYDMFNNSSSNFKERGIGLVTSALAVPVAYTSDDIVYKFPLQFGNTDSSNSGYVISQIPGVYYSTAKTRVNTVDGWGTLTTPFGTFSVLRLQSVIQQHDSVVIDSLGVNFGIDLPQAIEYKWLGAGKGIPLLQVTSNGGIPTQVVYRDSARFPISVPEVLAGDLSFEIFPNPSVSSVSVHYALTKATEVGFDVLTVEGKNVFSEKPVMQPAGEQTHVVKRSDIPAAGNYLLRMNAGGKYFTRPFVISK